MKSKSLIEILGNGYQYLMTALQTDEILKYVETTNTTAILATINNNL